MQTALVRRKLSAIVTFVVAGIALGASTPRAEPWGCKDPIMRLIVGDYVLQVSGFQENDFTAGSGDSGALAIQGRITIGCDGSVKGNVALTSTDSDAEQRACGSNDLASTSFYQRGSNSGRLSLDLGANQNACASGKILLRADFFDYGHADLILIQLGDGGGNQLLRVMDQTPAAYEATGHLERMAQLEY